MNRTTFAHEASLEDQLGLNIAARLNDAAHAVPHDISERLKAARELALSKRKVVKLAVATAETHYGDGSVALHMGAERSSLWARFASFIPLLVLIAGLLAINLYQDEHRTNELAEVDAELLTDVLPPAAYTDPGFAQFLNASSRE